jgi:hypothetical protein
MIVVVDRQFLSGYVASSLPFLSFVQVNGWISRMPAQQCSLLTNGYNCALDDPFNHV